MCSNSVSFREREALENPQSDNFTPPKEEFIQSLFFFIMFWFDTFSIIHREGLLTKRGFSQRQQSNSEKDNA